jgi:peptidyl-prolyl cis-trans isomerase SurA
LPAPQSRSTAIGWDLIISGVSPDYEEITQGNGASRMGARRSYLEVRNKQRRNYMNYSRSILLLGILLFSGQLALAQEGEAKLVDEVIARVNAGVIMRSAFEAEQKRYLESLKQEGLKGEELEKKFKEAQPQILDELINTQLLAQRAKELSINVEPQVNQQILRLMKEQNCDTPDCLGQKLRDVGYDLEELKRNMTEGFSKQQVIQNEVYYRIMRELTEKERRELYEKNKQNFTEPAEITLSRIFIASGKDADQALKRAQELATQCKAEGTDFAAMAKQYSEEPLAKDGGKLGPAIKVDQLTPEIKALVEKTAVGAVTDPIKLENGYYIFRIDDRKEEKLLPFEDERVNEAIVRNLASQQVDQEIDEYMTRLRDQAFIEIDPRYQFENAKVKSAAIKRVPYMEEKERKKEKEREKKEKEKEAKQAAQAKDNSPEAKTEAKTKDKKQEAETKDKKQEAPTKATANNKP